MSAILLGPIGIVELIANGADGIADLSAFRRVGERLKHLSVLTVAEPSAAGGCLSHSADHLIGVLTQIGRELAHACGRLAELDGETCDLECPLSRMLHVAEEVDRAEMWVVEQITDRIDA